MAEASGDFSVTSWDEETYAELEAGKLTRAKVMADFTGDIAGSGRVEWLMCYRGDGTADYVGFQDIEATLDGRRGGFVVTSTGTFDGKVAEGPWTIVEGSGRGDLATIAGSGHFSAPLGGGASYRLDYQLG